MSPKRPEVSVIVPVYNAGEFLAPCIRSVLAQTMSDFELLLIDDASTDGSLAVCQSFESDSRVRVVRSEHNGGVSAARNRGIDLALGCYLTFLDADDSLHPEFLRTLLNACTANGCLMAVNGFRQVTPDWHLDLSKSWPGVNAEDVRLYLPEEAVEATLYQTGLTNNMCGVLYNASLFDGYRFRITRYEDLDSFYRLFLLSDRIAYIPSPMYYYTMNPGSYMHVFTPERAVVLDVTDRIVEYMRRNYPQLLPAAEDRALSAAFNIFTLLARHRVDAPQLEALCKATIRKYRRASLLNRKVRTKNKIGILLSYAGGFAGLKAVGRLHKNG